MPDFPERLIALQPFWDSWLLDSFIGEGSYGKVYRIRREEMGVTTFAALKWITLPHNQSELSEYRSEGLSEDNMRQLYRENIRRFREEIDLMAQLKGNSHVVNYEDHLIRERKDEIGWDILIRMEWLTPLSNVVRAGITVGDVVKLGLDICDALALCAKAHIIHRDIKSDNIFISRFGEYKLGDFGVARSMEDQATHLSRQGTPTYMAPEVYLGKGHYDATVDIYSLGLVMHRLLNNQRMPFLPIDGSEMPTHAERNTALETRLRGVPLQSPENAELVLAKVICKACAYEPGKRYQTAAEMRDALQKAASRTDLSKSLRLLLNSPGATSGRSSLQVKPSIGETTVARQAQGNQPNTASVPAAYQGSGHNMPKPKKPYRWLWMLLAILAALLVGVAGAMIWMNQGKTGGGGILSIISTLTPSPVVTPTLTPSPVPTATPTPTLSWKLTPTPTLPTPTPSSTLPAALGVLSVTPNAYSLGYDVSWPGSATAIYTISICPADSPFDYVRSNVQGTDYHIQSLLPDTKYNIQVTNTKNSQEYWATDLVSQSAQSFTEFGGNNCSITLFCAPPGDQSDYSFDQLQAMTKSEISKANGGSLLIPTDEANFYLLLSWNYSLESTDTEKTITYFLQTPSGEIYADSFIMTCNAADADTTWNLYHRINDMLSIFQAHHNSMDTGTYKFQVYFNNDLFGSYSFTLEGGAVTAPRPSSSPTPTPTHTVLPTASPLASTLDNLVLIPDTEDLSCQASWTDGTDGLSYEIALRPMGAPRDCYATVVNAKSCNLENLLPDSQYSLTVTERSSRRSVTRVFQTGSVETYHIYHAVPNMAHFIYITNEELQAANGNEFNADYHKVEVVQADDLPAVYSKAAFYLYLKWTYAVVSDAHTSDVLVFLKTPENELYYQKYKRSFEATLQPRCFWRSYLNIDDVISAWRTDHQNITKGTYKIRVYMDHLFFRKYDFVVE